MSTFDYLIVGAGFAGCVLAERLATQAGKRVLVVDRRDHIGGNAYDYYNQDGVLVHPYGPHIFHTNSQRIFDYLSKFTSWRPFELRVLASVDGKRLPIPINRTTVNGLYGMDLHTDDQCAEFYRTRAEAREHCRTSEDVMVSKVGRDLYEKFIRGYTRKHWGLDPSQLDAQVAARVAARVDTDDRYFTDTYQFMPLHGYTKMFERMLDHGGITVMLGTDSREVRTSIPHRELIYTGPIDEYFDCCYGALQYRSLEFRHETLDLEQHQPVAIVTYPNEHAYTRITEFKHLTGQEHTKTTIAYEYPRSSGDPFYPIPSPECTAQYNRYKALANTQSGVHFVGRLATYKYYNMDQVVGQGLAVFDRLTASGVNHASVNP